ncbi:Lrp/AsnC family transcriptional regulator [Mangrovicoccus algicola]|uniref:Lrp/AsnC family transcriptional regulator n=1 Tax=Mangrovicoccus algicola TaxID=2771008 RepID=A0A8J6YZF3_9RHOB|nr:Lrp/AsnC family transcriptional regulator [Mangrovicoccus algicola]MBE3638663.1 Lrp/AsnC family transcriptional regulator [Mangrovicoccus algicola]
MQTDDTDRRLLRQLQAAPDLAIAELADRANVSAATARRRLERMRAAGLLRGPRAVIDWEALGYRVEVSLRIAIDKTVPGAFDLFLDEARKIPEVTEIQTFLGRVDLRLSVRARDMADYQRLYRDRILALPHMADIEALVRVATVFERESLPL